MTPETVRQMNWADPDNRDNWETIGEFIINESRSYHEAAELVRAAPGVLTGDEDEDECYADHTRGMDNDLHWLAYEFMESETGPRHWQL